jgi:hypothetical protein
MAESNEPQQPQFYSNTDYSVALRTLGISPTASTQTGRLEQIAIALGVVPRRKNKKGEYTNTLLKVGSKLWEQTIKDEVMARYRALNPAPRVREPIRKKNTARDAVSPTIVQRKLIKKIAKFEKFYVRAEGVNRLRDLYAVIKSEEARLGGLNFVSLILTNEDSEVRMIGISANYLDTYRDFKDRIEAIRTGAVEGSDEIGEEWSLILNEFHISTLPIQIIGGKSDGIVWECEGIESKENYCGYECLKRLGFEYTGDDLPAHKKKMRNYQEFQKYIVDNKLRVNIITNAFHLTNTCKNIMDSNGKERIFINYKNRKNELRIISPLKPSDIYPSYLRRESVKDKDGRDALYTDEGGFNHIIWDDTVPSIIYDELNSHFDVMSGLVPQLRSDIRLTASSEIMRGDKILYTAKQLNISAHVPHTCKHRYLFFDYETVIDFEMSSCMRPYSLSVLWLDEEKLKILEEGDRDGTIDPNFFRELYCKTFLGYDCNTEFIRWFMGEFSDDITYTFVGFNNACFDNFILLDGLLDFNQYEHNIEYGVNNVFYNGSQLLNFTIDGRHTFFDIRKHLVGSLSANCKSFKINCCAKKSFDHSLAQSLHKEDKLLAFIHGNEELKEYNEYDVLATAVLFQRYRLALIKIPATKKYGENLKEYITIGSLVYNVFKEHTKTLQKFDDKGEIKPMFGKLSYTHYKDLQKYKIAGRVELFNGIQKIQERMASTDVCSLYPFVMSVLNVYYPCGDIVEVEEYKGDDEIGFYYCDIDQSNLSAQNLPKIYARKTEIENDWGHDEILNDYLISNVMIGLLRKYGCSVVVKQGFIFSRREKSSHMFKFILEMMSAKNGQDTLKSNKDSAYNPALRETLKLLMNSLSGKVIEGLHTEKTTDISNMYEYEKIQEKATSVNFINSIGNRLFITYEVDEEKLCETQQRPIFLGCLIYDYAKRYMFDMSYSKIGKNDLVYTDTDASKFKYSAMTKWEEWIHRENITVPCWEEAKIADPRYNNHLIYQRGSKVFGSFEDELEDFIGDNYRFYCVEKKSWSYEAFNADGSYAKDGGDDCMKFKFKGLNGKALITDLSEPFIERKVINRKDGTQLTKYQFLKNTEEEVYEYCERNKNLNIESGNVGRFFDMLFDSGEAYVICNSFRKIVKNSSRMVEYGDEAKYNSLMNKIQVNYSLKHIKLARDEKTKFITDSEIYEEDA